MDSLSPEDAAKEEQIYATVVRLEEVHEAYEKQLKDLEDELAKVYALTAESLNGGGEVNEEILAVIKEAEDSSVGERIDLSDRQLKLLPEALGKIAGLVSLNLSRNDLKLSPDTISGLEKLEELDLSSNVFDSLPDSIGKLFNLRILNVTGEQANVTPRKHCTVQVTSRVRCQLQQLDFFACKLRIRITQSRKAIDPAEQNPFPPQFNMRDAVSKVSRCTHERNPRPSNCYRETHKPRSLELEQQLQRLDRTS